jgi:hypothetical protein
MKNITGKSFSGKYTPKSNKKTDMIASTINSILYSSTFSSSFLIGIHPAPPQTSHGAFTGIGQYQEHPFSDEHSGV